MLDETITPKTNLKNELGNIDYAGITKTGENVMGLAYFDYDTYKFNTDSVLSWKVPDSWSLQDAVTIPHAYATVS